MGYSLSRLPTRFPVGTKFVIEGRRAGEGQPQVFTRYLEFPDGTFFPLPSAPRRKSSLERAPRVMKRSAVAKRELERV